MQHLYSLLIETFFNILTFGPFQASVAGRMYWGEIQDVGLDIPLSADVFLKHRMALHVNAFISSNPYFKQLFVIPLATCDFLCFTSRLYDGFVLAVNQH